MMFRVIKSSLDGMSGGETRLSIDEACNEINYSKGWKSLKQLRAAIKTWAKLAVPGDVFKTAVSAVIACGTGERESAEDCPECLSTDIDYGDMEPVMDGKIQQGGTCNECGHRWMGVFRLAERRKLTKKK